ncbi:hypothetical protein V7139_09570 [Neobacillus drentensis]|uniref:hypothetical protein n=1 Tax=Neobacillus drentensis TaxID=220684 RepID=UPI0030035DE5
MLVFLDINNENRIVALSSTKSDNNIEIEVPEEHEVFSVPFIFKLENGQLVKDEVYQQQLIREKEEQLNKPSVENQLELLQKALDDLILGVML